MDTSNAAARQQQPNNTVGKAKRRSGPRSRSSPYKGVTQYRRTGKWEAHIWIPGTSRGKGHQRHLGSYETAEDAARCFDRATIHVRGTHEELNFPLQNYSEDQFMLEHARAEKFKFLDLMRSKFAIPSEIQTSRRPSSQAQNPRPRSNTNKNLNSNHDPDYSVTIRPSPSSALATYASHPSRPHLPPRTTISSKIMFKRQQNSPRTPQVNQLMGTTLAAAPGSNCISAPPAPRGGRLVGMLSNDARMSMRRLSNYTNQRIQQRQRACSVEDEEEEEEVDDTEDIYTALINQPPLFSPAETAWINATTTTPPTVDLNQSVTSTINNKDSLSFPSTIAGLSMTPAAAPTTVLPSRCIGTYGPTMPSSFPTIYNALQFQNTGASSAYAVQESVHGEHLNPDSDDLFDGIQMISGQDVAAPEYKDWLCNSPCQGMAPSPSAAGSKSIGKLY